jgi:hypothetical protein
MRSRAIYLGHDVPEYNERLRKAISRYGVPPGAPRVWLRDPDFEAWDRVGCMQSSGAIFGSAICTMRYEPPVSTVAWSYQRSPFWKSASKHDWNVEKFSRGKI